MAGGQLKSDGRATLGGVTAPAGTLTFGELYRINGITGIALKTVASGDTDRNLDMEIAPDRIWYVPVGAGVTANQGDYLYWTTKASATFQRGDTHLIATAAGAPAAFVEETKDASNIVAIRVLNVGPSGT